MKKNLFLLSFLLIGIACVKKSTDLSVTIHGEFPKNMGTNIELIITELLPSDSIREPKIIEISANADNSFSEKTAIPSPGFYSALMCVGEGENKVCVPNTLYLKPGNELRLSYDVNEAGMPILNAAKLKDLNNKMLTQYENAINELKFIFWSDTHAKNEQYYKEYLNDINSQYLKDNPKLEDIDEDVNIYLKNKSYGNYCNELFRLPREEDLEQETVVLSHNFYDLPFAASDYFNNPHPLLISDMLEHLNSYLNVKNGFNIWQHLSLSQIEENIEALKGVTTQPKICDNVIDLMLKSYISGYQMNAGFDKDKAAFITVLQHIQSEKMRDDLKARFENLAFLSVGAPIPQFEMKNAEGKTVSPSDLIGKLLYIDLWASWCAPCCREIPVFQEVEKKYAKKAVTFVSISIDDNSKDWMKKMEELNMHGIQLISGSSSDFATKLNVVSIPRYLIYDSKGKLLYADAPSPSSEELEPLLDLLLQQKK